MTERNGFHLVQAIERIRARRDNANRTLDAATRENDPLRIAVARARRDAYELALMELEGGEG